MGLLKKGTVFVRKDVRTAQYNLFFVLLGSKNGTAFLLNRHGNIMSLSVSFLESLLRMNEMKVISNGD